MNKNMIEHSGEVRMMIYNYIVNYLEEHGYMILWFWIQ